MSNIDLLNQAFTTSLGIPQESVIDSLEYNSIPAWDSTAHMILIAELESQFNVMLDTDDIIDMSSFAKAKQILSKYDVQFDA